ncbi:MAG: hypothetical protein U0R71_06260 [Solirubrobacterales bacterium]
MTPSARLRDQSGTTLVELMVGLMMGMVILSALTMVVVVTMHGSARVSARVEATQNGRIVLARITEELHSACIYPKLAPIRKESTGTELRFVHAASGQGQAVAPTPVETRIKLSGGTLTRSDYAYASGSAPSWSFATTAGATQQLMTQVAAISPSTAIFRYYAYKNGGLEELPASPLSEAEAARTIQVGIGIDVSPSPAQVADQGADAVIQDAAALRLTPPSFNENATASPCQ